VRVVDEASLHVVDKRGQRVRHRRPTDTGDPFAREIGADRLSITLEVTGDGRDRPSPPSNRACTSTSSLLENMVRGSSH
jgi:hypothetical protein